MGLHKCDFAKLRLNLKLGLTRLDVLVKKRNELLKQSRAAIADLLKKDRITCAQIRVCDVIREDYFIGAVELIITYFELLLRSLDAIENHCVLDYSLKEAISTIIWSMKVLQADLPEGATILKQLKRLCGKKFTKRCISGQESSINLTVRQKLDVVCGKNMSEMYLVKIAQTYNIPYEPDRNVVESLLTIKRSTVDSKDAPEHDRTSNLSQSTRQSSSVFSDSDDECGSEHGEKDA